MSFSFLGKHAFVLYQNVSKILDFCGCDMVGHSRFDEWSSNCETVTFRINWFTLFTRWTNNPVRRLVRSSIVIPIVLVLFGRYFNILWRSRCRALAMKYGQYFRGAQKSNQRCSDVSLIDSRIRCLDGAWWRNAQQYTLTQTYALPI